MKICKPCTMEGVLLRQKGAAESPARREEFRASFQEFPASLTSINTAVLAEVLKREKRQQLRGMWGKKRSRV